MKKKNFNNLLDSVLTTLHLLIWCVAYFFVFYSVVFHPQDGKNNTLILIVFTIICGISILSLSVLIFIYCYEYWVINDEYILSKKLFRQKRIIKIDQITSITKKEINALIYSVFKSDAYIITNGKDTIKILINDKNELYLRQKINMLTQHHK